MKTTTKIMIGILGFMVLMLIALIIIVYYHSPEYNSTNDEGLITYETSSKAITFPGGYKYIKWDDGSNMAQINNDITKLEGILLERSIITICTSDTATSNVLRLPDQLAKYLNISTKNDTLCIKLSATKEQISEVFHKDNFASIGSKMQLCLLPEVEEIRLFAGIGQVSLEGINSDNFSIRTLRSLIVNNCQIKNFTPYASDLKLNSGSIEKLNLDLDTCVNWEVADSCQIYHEVLTGSSTMRIALENHCKILEWEPKAPEVYVYLDLKRKAKIIIE